MTQGTSRDANYRRQAGRGVLVAFVGPDGAGKSTLVREVGAALAAAGLRTRAVFLGGYADPVLPTTRLLAARARSLRRASTGGPHGVADPASWLQELTLLNYICEFLVKYAIVLRPLLRRYDVVLADRYGYDFLIIPRRLTSLAWFSRLVCRIMPAPDLGYSIEGDPALFCQRKADNSIAESRRQAESFKRLRAWVPAIRSLSGTGNLRALVDMVVADVGRSMSTSRVSAPIKQDHG